MQDATTLVGRPWVGRWPLGAAVPPPSHGEGQSCGAGLLAPPSVPFGPAKVRVWFQCLSSPKQHVVNLESEMTSEEVRSVTGEDPPSGDPRTGIYCMVPWMVFSGL